MKIAGSYFNPGPSEVFLQMLLLSVLVQSNPTTDFYASDDRLLQVTLSK